MKRRSFNRLVLGSAAAGSFGLIAREAWSQTGTIRITEGGGLNGDSIEAGYIKPFTQKTGIRVVRESPNELGKLRAMVESGNPTSVLFELGAGSLQQAKSLGLLHKIDWAQIAPMAMFPEARDDYGMAYQYYSTMMSWRKGVKPLRTWADFYNVRDFPGKRTVKNDPVYALPTILLANGVPAHKLFPLNLDLAFAKLEEVKNIVAIWWKAGAQAPQLLRDNEVQYAMAYSGRVVGQEGIEYTYNQANLSAGYFGVVKGSRPADIEAAYKLLHEMTVPKNQLAAAEVVPYTGNSPDLEKLLPRDKLQTYATTAENKKIQFVNDDEWWFRNADLVQKRWQEFILKL